MVEKRGRKALPKTLKKSKGIYFVTTLKNHEEISTYCKKNKVTISEFIRIAVNEKLQK